MNLKSKNPFDATYVPEVWILVLDHQGTPATASVVISSLFLFAHELHALDTKKKTKKNATGVEPSQQIPM